MAQFDGLEPRRCEDIKELCDPKSFGTFEKQAPVREKVWSFICSVN